MHTNRKCAVRKTSHTQITKEFLGQKHEKSLVNINNNMLSEQYSDSPSSHHALQLNKTMSQQLSANVSCRQNMYTCLNCHFFFKK